MAEDIQFNWIKDLPAWGSFVGTCVVSVLAMFGTRLKNWFCRPSLKVEVDGTEAFCELFDEEVDERSDSDEVRNKAYNWCVRIRNVGRQTADNCRVQCSEIYQETDSGGQYVLKKKFISQPFYWQSGEKREDVVPGRDSWCRVFILAPIEVRHRNDDDANSMGSTRSNGLHLRLGVENGQAGRFISLRNKVKNTFLVPLVISFDNARKAETRWIYVHWTDGDQKPTVDNFTVKILAEKDVRKLIKG